MEDLTYQSGSDYGLYCIRPATTGDYSDITDVWEASVRATHHFLWEEDIQYYKSLLQKLYLPGAENLFCVHDTEGKLIAFIGIADRNIEMLFIHPVERGKGLGKHLIRFAIDTFRAENVDVNEQNEQALAFYRKMGFEVISRDAYDGTGKPYPILHLALT